MTEMVFGARPEQPAEPVIPRWWRTVDRWTVAAVLALMASGLILGMAASPPLAIRNELPEFHFVVRQAIFAAVGLAVMIFVSMQSPATLRRWSVLGFAAALVALALLPVLGTDYGKGATRWFSLGFIALQPSEFLKPAFVGFAAWVLSGSFDRHGPPGRTLSFLFAVLVAGMLAMQPDFGQAALVLTVWMAMYFVAGASMFLLVGLVGAAGAVGAFAYANSEHFARRIDGYLSPEVDPRTQLGYAANAIQEGGFFGVGVGEGTVKSILPDAHTDFIIAVAAEEHGLVFVMLIIALYLFIVVRALYRLLDERDAFVRLAGVGMAALIGLQSFINMGVAIRLLPAKGMTLPFISYGGSSMLAAAIGMGLLLAMTRKRPRGDVAEAMGGAA